MVNSVECFRYIEKTPKENLFYLDTVSLNLNYCYLRMYGCLCNCLRMCGTLWMHVCIPRIIKTILLLQHVLVAKHIEYWHFQLCDVIRRY